MYETEFIYIYYEIVHKVLLTYLLTYTQHTSKWPT